MTTRRWTGTGPEFGLEGWGGVNWTLRLEAARPGLYDGKVGPLLGLEGVATIGRWEPEALGTATLADVRCQFGHVVATYALPDWGEMTLRSTWTPRDDDAVDLLVELSARSVGDLKAVELMTLSALGGRRASGLTGDATGTVCPREPHCAGLTYDGREPDLAGLITMPPRGGIEPTPAVLRRADRADVSFVDLVHPDDESRRVADDGGTWVRRALFGHDLERGVVLRGRLRGFWCPSHTLNACIPDALARFLAEPLPLTT